MGKNRRVICLVACCKNKDTKPVEARNMYYSDLYREAVYYAERSSDKWYILSGKHYLLDPEKVIAPYNENLLKMTKAERKVWAKEVFSQLQEVADTSDKIVLIAGLRYRRVLLRLLKEAGYETEVPLKGKARQLQINWLKRDRVGKQLAFALNKIGGKE